MHLGSGARPRSRVAEKKSRHWQRLRRSSKKLLVEHQADLMALTRRRASTFVKFQCSYRMMLSSQVHAFVLSLITVDLSDDVVFSGDVILAKTNMVALEGEWPHELLPHLCFLDDLFFFGIQV